MILPIILLTILRFQYVLSTSHNTQIFSYSRTAQNDFGRYQTSLTNLLGTLASQTTNHGYYNFTTTSPQTPNQLHGLYLCRGEVDHHTCQSCVNLAKDDMLKNVLYGSDEGLAWYNNCMVRFSNKSSFGKWDTKMWTSSWENGKMKGSRIQFLRILWHTMKQLATEASNGKKFASKVVKVTSLESLYATVQCTPDLKASDCYRCLANANQKLLAMRGSTNGEVLYSSCMAQYKTASSISNDMVKTLSVPTFPEENNSMLKFTQKVRLTIPSFSNMTMNSSSTSSSWAISNSTVVNLNGTHHDAVQSE